LQTFSQSCQRSTSRWRPTKTQQEGCNFRKCRFTGHRSPPKIWWQGPSEKHYPFRQRVGLTAELTVSKGAHGLVP
jgi:hypothetical protein